MARTLGSAKTGGRKKGTPNQKTVDLQEALGLLEVDVPARLVALLPQLEPEKQADVLLGLMAFLYPKRKAIDIVPKEQTQEKFNLEAQQRFAKIVSNDPKLIEASRLVGMAELEALNLTGLPKPVDRC